MRSLLLVLLAGCRGLFGFEDPVVANGDALSDGEQPDDSRDPDGPVVSDDSSLCVGTYAPICLGMAPVSVLTINANTAVDTDVGCDAIVGGFCVRAATSIAITASGVLRAAGSRPLVLLATDAITIDGAVDVSSKRVGGPGAGANASACNAAGLPQGRGGGAGGTLGSRGGNGGSAEGGNAGGIAAANLAVPAGALHGGCAGSAGGNTGGAPGGGGGAVLIVAANQITINSSATINASGAGGAGAMQDGGGGGGGSGGMIVFDAPAFAFAGVAIANGGGGGEGGGGGPGGNGSDPTNPQVRAPGGSGQS